MALALPFEKNALKMKLLSIGLSTSQVEEISTEFDRNVHHLDVISFVSTVERFGLARGKIYAFLRDMGVDDPTLISVFSRADLKRAGLDESRIQEVVFSD